MEIPLLPRIELELWRMAVTDAVELALEGDLAGGYEYLLQGYLRALEAEATGEDCADDLVRCYREALNQYRERYGIDERVAGRRWWASDAARPS